MQIVACFCFCGLPIFLVIGKKLAKKTNWTHKIATMFCLCSTTPNPNNLGLVFLNTAIHLFRMSKVNFLIYLEKCQPYFNSCYQILVLQKEIIKYMKNDHIKNP
uniref:Uncharacterized protein n=1 Tax=Micrurus spixii TaxID=129469 RepID=A0A2D4MXF8_9SAUR